MIRSALYDLRTPLIGIALALVAGLAIGECHHQMTKPGPLAPFTEEDVERFDDPYMPPLEEPR